MNVKPKGGKDPSHATWLEEIVREHEISKTNTEAREELPQ